jgi:hypothetical protein
MYLKHNVFLPQKELCTFVTRPMETAGTIRASYGGRSLSFALQLLPSYRQMGELLQLYLGPDGRAPSSAFWLGASRIVDPRPVISGSLVAAVLATQPEPVADDWATVGADLREAVAQANGKTGSD